MGGGQEGGKELHLGEWGVIRRRVIDCGLLGRGCSGRGDGGSHYLVMVMVIVVSKV